MGETVGGQARRRVGAVPQVLELFGWLFQFHMQLDPAGRSETEASSEASSVKKFGALFVTPRLADVRRRARVVQAATRVLIFACGDERRSWWILPRALQFCSMPALQLRWTIDASKFQLTVTLPGVSVTWECSEQMGEDKPTTGLPFLFVIRAVVNEQWQLGTTVHPRHFRPGWALGTTRTEVSILVDFLILGVSLVRTSSNA